MKKLNKNILFGLGAISAVVAPVATLVACGNSNSTDTNKNGKQTSGGSTIGGSTTGGSTTSVIPNTTVLKVPATTTSSAWDATTKTIDLSQIKDQFEFAQVLGDVTGLNNLHQLGHGFDAFIGKWDSHKTELKTYWDILANKFENLLSARQNEDNINIKLGTETFAFNLNIYSAIRTLITETRVDKDTQTASEAAKGETRAGFPLMQNKDTGVLLTGLLQVNPGLAGTLMHLTNLPAKAFEQFKTIVANIQHTFVDLSQSLAFQNWITNNKNINMKAKDLTNNLTDTEIQASLTAISSLASSNFTAEEYANSLIGAHFITATLS